MKKTALLILVAATSLSACSNLSSDQRYATGGLAGGAAAYALADMLDADESVKVVGTLLGAAAGSTYAANGGFQY